MKARTGLPKTKRTKKHPKSSKSHRSSKNNLFSLFTRNLTAIGRPITFTLIVLLKTLALLTTPKPIRIASAKKIFSLKKSLSQTTPPHPKHIIALFNLRPPIIRQALNLLRAFRITIIQQALGRFRVLLIHQTLSAIRGLSVVVIQQPIQKFSSLQSQSNQKLNHLKSKFHSALNQFRVSVIQLPIQKFSKLHSLSSQTLGHFKSKTLSIFNRFTDSVLHQTLTGIRGFRVLVIQQPIQGFTKIKNAVRSFLSPHTQSLHRTLTKHRRLSLSALTILFSLGIATTSAYLFYQEILKDLPNPTDLASHSPNLSTKIYDRHGQLLYKIYQNENRSLVSLEDIPIHLQLATIAIEDQDFYDHSGVSLPGIIRAFKVNTTSNRFEGGSTITQQLIKNTLLTSERTYTRKIKEALLSVMVEFFFTKDQILTMYFNQVPYGGATYGIQEAARMYFHKEASELDLAESAFLAGLPAAPTHYSPYGAQPEQAKLRQAQVLRRMVEEGYVSQTQAAQARAQALNIHPHQNPIYAPHFVMYVKDYLANIYGHQMVEQGGLEVTTSLDLDLHNQIQAIVTDEVTKLTPLNIRNGAALVTLPKTGEIIAMVGSVDYFDTQNDGQVNVTLRLRQPGSSIKPINYAMALSNGFTPATIIPDTPICYNVKGQPPYCPKNYDGRYHGKVTARVALANSYNIPAVKTLFQFGVDQMIQTGQAMGITTWEDKNRFGLALTLGGGEIKMTELATAYGTFANLGIRVDPNPVLEVKDATGKTIYSSCHTHPNLPDPDTTCPGTRALDPRVAYQITDILSDNQARIPAFGQHSVLEIPGHQVAVKTGTTNSMRDNWTIGYTSKHLVATWVGNNDNTPMSYVASGITGASPIWNQIMVQFLDDQNPHAFAPPANLKKVAICPLTGTLACNGCPTKEEYFLPGTEPKRSCSQESIARILNPQPQSPAD